MRPLLDAQGNLLWLLQHLHSALFDHGADAVEVVSEATHGQAQHLDLRLRPFGSEDEHSVTSVCPAGTEPTRGAVEELPPEPDQTTSAVGLRPEVRGLSGVPQGSILVTLQLHFKLI